MHSIKCKVILQENKENRKKKKFLNKVNIYGVLNNANNYMINLIKKTIVILIKVYKIHFISIKIKINNYGNQHIYKKIKI